jgi:hypothetical protein
MTAGDLDQAANDLRRRRRRAREATALALVSGGLSLVAAALWPQLAVALAIGAAFETLVAGAAVVRRREQIARLAVEPAAYVLTDVERYGRRLAEPRQRARLASWLAEIVAEAPHPWSLYLPDRVALCRAELAALARDLAMPALCVEPTSAAACRRLLTHAVESPLYNPRLPADDLRLTLARIRAGIERPY